MRSASIAAALLLAFLVRGEVRALGGGEVDQILVIQRSLVGNTHPIFGHRFEYAPKCRYFRM